MKSGARMEITSADDPLADFSIKELQHRILRAQHNKKQIEKYIENLTQAILDREIGL